MRGRTDAANKPLVWRTTLSGSCPASPVQSSYWPVEIVLHADGVGHPFPAEEERHLLFVLYGRAVTQHA
jgi:hypothetical protein